MNESNNEPASEKQKSRLSRFLGWLTQDPFGEMLAAIWVILGPPIFYNPPSAPKQPARPAAVKPAQEPKKLDVAPKDKKDDHLPEIDNRKGIEKKAGFTR